MAIAETALAGGAGAMATFLITKVAGKLLKKDCTGCSLSDTVGTLKQGMVLLVKYSEHIPEEEKDAIMKGLVR